MVIIVIIISIVLISVIIIVIIHLHQLVWGGVLEDGGDGDGRDQNLLGGRLSGQGGELIEYDAQRCHEGWLAKKAILSETFPKDVERQPVNRPVTLLPSSRPEINSSGERPEITPSDEEFKPVQRDVGGWFEKQCWKLHSC